MNRPTEREACLLYHHICRALADSRRIRILYTLTEKPRNVTTLAKELNIPQPTVSHHLRKLLQHNLVYSERQGRSIYYRISDYRIIEVLDTLRSILQDNLKKEQQILSGHQPVVGETLNLPAPTQMENS